MAVSQSAPLICLDNRSAQIHPRRGSFFYRQLSGEDLKEQRERCQEGSTLKKSWKNVEEQIQVEKKVLEGIIHGTLPPVLFPERVKANTSTQFPKWPPSLFTTFSEPCDFEINCKITWPIQ